MVKTYDTMNENIKGYLKLRNDNISLYAKARIEELEEQLKNINSKCSFSFDKNIAKKFQVAEPHLSVKMIEDLPTTIWCWDINILDNTGAYDVIGLKLNDDRFTFKCPAPSIQDLMNILPQNIEYSTTYSIVVNKYSVFYENSLGETKHNFMVVSDNIANALCELYIHLKSANIIL